MELMISHLNNIGLHNLEDLVKFLFSSLLKHAKSTDVAIADKIKFILKDSALSETTLTAICDIDIISIAKPKSLEPPVATKKPVKKAPANQKFIHEYDYYDKCPYLPFFSENNCKIICYAQNFERMLRYNILDCTNKLFKIDDLDKEEFMNTLEEKYRNIFITPFISDLAQSLKKEIINFEINLIPQQ